MQCKSALCLCDLGAFGPLKTFLKGQRFSNDEKVKMAVKKCMLQVKRKFGTI